MNVVIRMIAIMIHKLCIVSYKNDYFFWNTIFLIDLVKQYKCVQHVKETIIQIMNI